MSGKPSPTTSPAGYVPARARTPWGQFQLRPSHLLTSIPGAAQFGPETPDPEICRAAARTVAVHVPRDEIRDVLQMLGLLNAGAS